MLRALFTSCLLSCALSSDDGAAASVAFAQAAQPAQHAPASWYLISPRNESFTFRVPAVPRVYVSQREDESSYREIGGAQIKRQLTLHAYHDGAVYLVHLYKTSSPDRLMRALVRNELSKAVLLRDLKAEGLDGEEYETNHENAYVRTRFVKSGKFLYELQAAARDTGDPTLAAFLSSFGVGEPNRAPVKEVVHVVAPSRQPDAPGGGAPTGDAGPVLNSREVTRKAVILYKPEPIYTEEARRRSITGEVKIRLVLASGGEVTNVAVIDGLEGGLTETAVEAARSIRFLPAEKDGRRVSQYAMVVYNYNIY